MSKEKTFFFGFCYCPSTFHTCDDLKSVMIYSAVQMRLPNAVSDIISSHWRLFFVKEFSQNSHVVDVVVFIIVIVIIALSL